MITKIKSPDNKKSASIMRLLAVGFPPKMNKEITQEIERCRHTVISAFNAEQAKALFKESHFDLVLIDVQQIDIFAPHFIYALRGSTSNSTATKVIAVDNSGFEGLALQLNHSGADYVVRDWKDPVLNMLGF